MVCGIQCICLFLVFVSAELGVVEVVDGESKESEVRYLCVFMILSVFTSVFVIVTSNGYIPNNMQWVCFIPDGFQKM